MKPIIFTFFVFYIVQLTIAQRTFRAAVVDYAHVQTSSLSVEEQMLKNVQEYMSHIEHAKRGGADIIVFPEYGITSLEGNNRDQYATFVPNGIEGIAPCDTSSNYSKVLVELSCFAKSGGIYVVVNLIEKDSQNSSAYYNTNVVYNRTGHVVARYRKINPYDEPFTPGNEEITFTTDFGVKFGIFTCFDILFRHPAKALGGKVANVIFPTAWFSETPFLTALSVQAGYARANGINLLASNYVEPSRGAGGSGIYMMNGTMKTVIPTALVTNMIIQDVAIHANPKFTPVYERSGSSRGVGQLPNIDNFKTKKEDMKSYIFEKIDLNKNGVQNVSVCEGESCCFLQVVVKNTTSNIVYKLALRIGLRLYGNSEHFIRTCGIVACSTDDVSTCGDRVKASENVGFESIKLIARHPKKESAFYFPTTLKANLDPLQNSDYTYETFDEGKTTRVEMATTSPQNSLLGFAIYGRDSAENSVPWAQANLFMLLLAGIVMWFNY